MDENAFLTDFRSARGRGVGSFSVTNRDFSGTITGSVAAGVFRETGDAAISKGFASIRDALFLFF